MADRTPAPGKQIRLLASDEKEPAVKLAVGKRFDVVAVTVVDGDMKQIDELGGEAASRPPRLCSSHSTCVAIVEIE